MEGLGEALEEYRWRLKSREVAENQRILVIKKWSPYKVMKALC